MLVNNDVNLLVGFVVMSVFICSPQGKVTNRVQRYQYCMPGATKLSNGKRTNDNNTTVPSSSLSVDAVTVAVALPWVWRVYST